MNSFNAFLFNTVIKRNTMSAKVQSINFYRTYEYLIVSNLNISKISGKLLETNLIQEDELCSLSAIFDRIKQNARLLRILSSKKVAFHVFLQVLNEDRSYSEHTELAKGILARESITPEDQLKEEIHRTNDGTCPDYSPEDWSDSDSSVFANETRVSPDSDSFHSSEELCVKESRIIELTRKEDIKEEFPIHVFRKNVHNLEIQKKSIIISFFSLLFFVLAILVTPLQLISKCIKFMLMK